MPVYFIQQGDDGPVKIGVAKNVRQRVSFIKTSSAEPIHIRAVYEGDVSEERALHDAFAAYHIKREWFRPSVLLEPVMLPPIAFDDMPKRPYVRSAASVIRRRQTLAASRNALTVRERRVAGHRMAGATISIRAACAGVLKILEELAAPEGVSDRRARYLRNDAALQLRRFTNAFRNRPDALAALRARGPDDPVGRSVLRAVEAVRAALDARVSVRPVHTQTMEARR